MHLFTVFCSFAHLKKVLNVFRFYPGSCYEGEKDSVDNSSGKSASPSYIGCDVSHRGGAPGFVRVTSASSLIWPDYVGDCFFNSLGALRLGMHPSGSYVHMAVGDDCEPNNQWQQKGKSNTIPSCMRARQHHGEWQGGIALHRLCLWRHLAPARCPALSDSQLLPKVMEKTPH